MGGKKAYTQAFVRNLLLHEKCLAVISYISVKKCQLKAGALFPFFSPNLETIYKCILVIQTPKLPSPITDRGCLGI